MSTNRSMHPRQRASAVVADRHNETVYKLKLDSIEAVIKEFERLVRDLAEQIGDEEARTGITDPHHFAYSPLAKAARQRQTKLSASVADLKVKLDAARRVHEVIAVKLDK